MTSMTIKTLLWASSSALALGLAGCGGDSSFIDKQNGSGSGSGSINNPNNPGDSTTASRISTTELTASDQGILTASGSADPSTSITITFPSGEQATVLSDLNGNFTVSSTSAEPEGNVLFSDALGTATSTNPNPISYVIDFEQSSQTTLNNLVTLNGSTLSGVQLNVTLPSGETLSTLTNAEGNFELTSTNPQPRGAINYALNAAGSLLKSVTENYVPLLSLELVANANGTLTANGTASPGSRILVTFADGTEQQAFVGSTGAYSVVSQTPQSSGQVIASLQTRAGAELTQLNQSYTDVDAPQAPVASAVVQSDGTVTVSGTAEAGTTLAVTFPGSVTQTVQVDSNGRFSVTSGAVVADAALTEPEQTGMINIRSTDDDDNPSAVTRLTITLTDPLLTQKQNFDALIDTLETEGRYVFGAYEPQNANTPKGYIDTALDTLNLGALGLARDVKTAFEQNRSAFTESNLCISAADADSDLNNRGCFLIEGQDIADLLGGEYRNWDFKITPDDLIDIKLSPNEIDRLIGETKVYIFKNQNPDKNLNDVVVSGAFSYPYAQRWSSGFTDQIRYVGFDTESSEYSIPQSAFYTRDDYGVSVAVNRQEADFSAASAAISGNMVAVGASTTISTSTRLLRDIAVELILTDETIAGSTMIPAVTRPDPENPGETIVLTDSVTTEVVSTSDANCPGASNGINCSLNSRFIEADSGDFAGTVAASANVQVRVTQFDAAGNVLSSQLVDVPVRDTLEVSARNRTVTRGAFNVFDDPTTPLNTDELFVFQKGSGFSVLLNDNPNTPDAEFVTFSLPSLPGSPGEVSTYRVTDTTEIEELSGFEITGGRIENEDPNQSLLTFSGDLSLQAPNLFRFNLLNPVNTRLNTQATINGIEFEANSVLNSNSVSVTATTQLKAQNSTVTQPYVNSRTLNLAP